jgi:hypothetical protein
LCFFALCAETLLTGARVRSKAANKANLFIDQEYLSKS